MTNKKKIIVLTSLFLILIGCILKPILFKNQSANSSQQVAENPEPCDSNRIQTLIKQIRYSSDPKAEYEIVRKDNCAYKREVEFQNSLWSMGFCSVNESADTPEKLLSLIQNLSESGEKYAKDNFPRVCKYENYDDIGVLKAFDIDWSKSELNQMAADKVRIQLYSVIKKDQSTHKIEAPTLTFEKWNDGKWRRPNFYRYPCGDFYSSTYSHVEPTRYISYSNSNMIISTASSCGSVGVLLGDGLSGEMINQYPRKFIVYENGQSEEISTVFNNIFSRGRYAEYPLLRSLNAIKENVAWIVMGGSDLDSKIKLFKHELVKETEIEKACPGISFAHDKYTIYKSDLFKLSFYSAEGKCYTGSFGIIINQQCVELEPMSYDCEYGGYKRLESFIKVGSEYWLHFSSYDGDTDSNWDTFEGYDPKTQTFIKPKESKK